MPLISTPSYTPPRWIPGGHLQTIIAAYRKVASPPFSRLAQETEDGDFFHIDSRIAPKSTGKNALLLSHGMEGNAQRAYMTGMSNAFLDFGFDTFSRHCRGCSGVLNRTAPMYHSGQTEDMETAVAYLLDQGYKNIVLIGFSMGGNQVLKYLGEKNNSAHNIACAVVFSVPVDLAGCAKKLDAWQNILYMQHFLYTLRQKVRQKHGMFPAEYPVAGLWRIHSFASFDSRYTAPHFGYASALDYWQYASCLGYLHSIRTPVLLVTARNDPFLSDSCYPVDLARHHACLYLEIPDQGGHVGFIPATRKASAYWSEQRAVEFVRDILQTSS